MKKKKNKIVEEEIVSFENFETKFYVYYDDETKEILSVSNEKNSVFTNFIEIPFERYEFLVSGAEKFSEYRIGTRLDNTLGLIPVTENKYAFKNEILSWITEPPTDSTELVLEWNKENKVWKFELSSRCLSTLSLYITNQQLLFFIILESDFDFLIRTIQVDAYNLTLGPVYIPFNSKFEEDVGRISVSTKTVFKSYGLYINE